MSYNNIDSGGYEYVEIMQQNVRIFNNEQLFIYQYTVYTRKYI